MSVHEIDHELSSYLLVSAVMRSLAPLLALLLSTTVLDLRAAGDLPVGVSPFGLDAGMSREEVEAITGPLRVVREGVFLATKLPGGYPELESYTLFVTPEHGLCRIQGTSEVIPSDSWGQPLRERFDRLMERLWEAHGYPEIVDRVSEGSDWAKRDEWMVALFEKDRVLMSLWTELQGSNLPPEVDRVTLAARALKTTEGFLTLDYVLSSWSRCKLRFSDSMTEVEKSSEP